MNLAQTLRVAVRALLRNKMRSFLTTLGVIIGVGAVIAMVAIGEGAKAKVRDAFAAMGTNLLIVMSGSTRAGGVRGGFGSQPTLTWADLDAIEHGTTGVQRAAPLLRITTSVVSEDQNWTTQVQGTTPAYFELRSWPPRCGRALAASDVDAQTQTVLLGRTVADRLYGADSDPTGQSVRINNVPFEVVGVLAAKGQAPTGQDYDDGAFVPATTFRTRLQRSLGNFLNGVIFVQAPTAAEIPPLQITLSALLRDRHQLDDSKDDDFSIRNLSEMASAQESGTKTLTTLLSSIAAVSLLVGGIGIMNIMLVSVTERTKEIGLRMAVGAKSHQILEQFLAEAVALSMIGGALGVGLGVGVAKTLASRLGWPILIPPDVVLIALGFSTVVGVSFGLYPAQKAARLDPIRALRHE